MNGNINPIPEDIKSTYEMLKGAYPAGIPKADYFPLLALMKSTEMSDRAVAHSIAYYQKSDYTQCFYDVAHVLPNVSIAQEDVDRIRKILGPFGYESWAKED